MSASCHAPSGRCRTYSPSTVSSVERAAGAPTDRRRRTSFTGATLSCDRMLAVTGGIVADAYSGTRVEANVEVDGGGGGCGGVARGGRPPRRPAPAGAAGGAPPRPGGKDRPARLHRAAHPSLGP